MDIKKVQSAIGKAQYHSDEAAKAVKNAMAATKDADPTPPVKPPVDPPVNPVDPDLTKDGAMLGVRGGNQLFSRVFSGKKYVTEKVAGLVKGFGADNFLVRGANILLQSGVTLVDDRVKGRITDFSFPSSNLGGIYAPTETDFPTPAGYGLFVTDDGAHIYVKGYSPGTIPVPPVDPGLAVCGRGPTVYDGTYLTQNGAHVNWDGDGVGELSAFLLQGGKIVESFEKMSMTTNNFELTWKTRRDPGEYELRLVATKCRGEDTKKFTIKGAVIVDPPTKPPVDPIPVSSGNEFPNEVIKPLDQFNFLDLNAIPEVQFAPREHRRTDFIDIESPFMKAVHGDQVKALLRQSTMIPLGVGVRNQDYMWDPERGSTFSGQSSLQPWQVGQMTYQQDALSPSFMQDNDWSKIDYKRLWEYAQNQNETAIRLRRSDYLDAGKWAMGTLLYDFEWGTAWGDGTNEDRAIYVLMCAAAAAHKPDARFMFGPFYQGAMMFWGTSRKHIGRSAAFFTPVQRSAILEKCGFPEQFYGKCMADFSNIGSVECAPLFEDRLPHGHIVRDRDGRALNTRYGPFVIERTNESSRHWIADVTGPAELYNRELPDFRRYVNLDYYCLGGSGYYERPITLDGIPDFWVQKPNQGDPNNDAWGLHRPAPLFHCAAWAPIVLFTGAHLVSNWCNDPGIDGIPVPNTVPWTDNVLDLSPADTWKRSLARTINTKVSVNGEMVGYNDVCDGTEEYLLDNTEARYSGLNRLPEYGTDRGDGRGVYLTFKPIAEGTFLKLDSVDRKILQLPHVAQIVNRQKRLMLTLGVKGYTSDVDTTITTRFEGKEINTFHLREEEIMIRIDRY